MGEHAGELSVVVLCIGLAGICVLLHLEQVLEFALARYLQAVAPQASTSVITYTLVASSAMLTASALRYHYPTNVEPEGGSAAEQGRAALGWKKPDTLDELS